MSQGAFQKNFREVKNNTVQDYIISFPSCLMSMSLQMHALNVISELLLNVSLA